MRWLFNLVEAFLSSAISLWWALRGGSSLSQFFFSLLLGFALGLLPFSMLSVALIILLLFLNFNIVLVLLSFISGHLLSYALAHPLSNAGAWLLDHGGQVMLPHLTDKAFIALMGFEHPEQWGALLVVLMAIPISYALGAMLHQAHCALDITGAKHPLLSLLVDERHGIRNTYQVHGLFSIQRFCTAIMVTMAGFFLLIFMIDNLLSQWLDRELTAISGMEVRIDDLDLSILGRSFTIEQLSMVDPEHSEMEVFHALNIKGSFEFGALLHKTMVIPELLVENLWLDNPATPEAEAAKEALAVNLQIDPAAPRTQEATYQFYTDKLYHRLALLPDRLVTTADESSAIWVVEKMTLRDMVWLRTLPHFHAIFENLSPFTPGSSIDPSLTLTVKPQTLHSSASKQAHPLKKAVQGSLEEWQHTIEDSLRPSH